MSENSPPENQGVIKNHSNNQTLCSQPNTPSQSFRTDSNNLLSYQPRIKSDFEFKRVIGEGSYSTVLLAKEKTLGGEFAIKVLSKRHIIKEKKVKYVNIEKEVLQKVFHQFIIKLFYTFQDQNSLFFVLEYAENGDLLDLLKQLVCFEPHIAQFYIAEIIVSVDFLNQSGYLHRDLKPENILISKDMHIKLTDFGSAKQIYDSSDLTNKSNKEKRNSFVGTAEYCSPELLNDRLASEKTDYWAIGCILFQMLTGQPPFKAPNEYLTFQLILKAEYKIPESVGPKENDLISKILVLDIEKRLDMPSIKSHPFFESFDWLNILSMESPLVNFKPIKKALSGLSEMIQLLELSDQIPELTDNFQSASESLLIASSTSSLDSDRPVASPIQTTQPDFPAQYNSFKIHSKTQLNSFKTEYYADILKPNEKIIKHGQIMLKKLLYHQPHVILLTNFKRLFIISEKSTHSDKLSWMENCTAELRDSFTFVVRDGKKKHVCKVVFEPAANEWVECINHIMLNG